MNNLSPSYHAMTYAHEACAWRTARCRHHVGQRWAGTSQPCLRVHVPNHPEVSIAAVLLAGWVCLFLAALPLLADPTITQDPTNLCVSLGGDARFQVSVGGTSPFDFQWHFTNNGTTFPLDSVPNPSSCSES